MSAFPLRAAAARNTALDFRATNEIDDLIASLTAWRRSIAAVGYDRNYALTDRWAAMYAAAKVFECDALAEMADGGRPTEDPDAELFTEADYRYDLQRDAA